jgi:hypothetical protein
LLALFGFQAYKKFFEHAKQPISKTWILWYNNSATQFLYSRRPKLGKSVGFARHIRLDVKLCSNNERDRVFRCVVSATHFFDFGGML